MKLYKHKRWVMVLFGVLDLSAIIVFFFYLPIDKTPLNILMAVCVGIFIGILSERNFLVSDNEIQIRIIHKHGPLLRKINIADIVSLDGLNDFYIFKSFVLFLDERAQVKFPLHGMPRAIKLSNHIDNVNELIDDILFANPNIKIDDKAKLILKRKSW